MKASTGLMMAMQNGNYTTVPGDTCIQGKRRVDVAALYDTQAYRARIDTHPRQAVLPVLSAIHLSAGYDNRPCSNPPLRPLPPS